ncbi:MAG TPA: hypothetical protein VD999_00710 [Vitreimonas sp.]|nr:hypothetical protein [Vitreimonas sp.]
MPQKTKTPYKEINHTTTQLKTARSPHLYHQPTRIPALTNGENVV